MPSPSEGDVLDAFRLVMDKAPAFLFGKARIHAEHGLRDSETGKPMRGLALRTQAAYVLGNLDGWTDPEGARARTTLRAFLRESREIPMGESAFNIARDFYRNAEGPLSEARRVAGKPLTEAAVTWGKEYAAGSYFLTPDQKKVRMFRKGTRVRFYTDGGEQVGPEQANVGPAVAYALAHGWKDSDMAGLRPIGGHTAQGQ